MYPIFASPLRQHEQVAMRSKALKYILIVLLVPHLFLVAVSLLFGFFRAQAPAPHLSNSVSFNEKARWLNDHLNSRCDFLVIGSSMALNNLDAQELASQFPGNVVVNTASWGMSVEESYTMLKKIIPLCKPKTIVLVTNYLDFSSTGNKEIAWDRFGRYLNASLIESTYTRGFDLFYLADDLKYQSDATRERRDYGSLAFDDTGTVNLDCKQFHIDPRRWDGYKFDHLATSGIRPAALDAITSMANTANEANSRFVVIATPMRPAAEASFYPEIRAELWDSVRRRVENRNGVYLHVAGTNGFNDELFADFLHLNACGAKKLTQLAAHALRDANREKSP